MCFYVYIIKSDKTDKYYTGASSDVQKRLSEHNANKVSSTRKRGPWTLLHVERFDSKGAALKREFEIKRYKGGNAFKKLVGSQYSGIV